ncbi:MAG TPA: DNA repair exonuclease [Gemmatimonadales bacterium]|jgi:DNA repair exonuclease SbcCD nuclease subunit
MRLAHLADPHLGFRQFHRLNERGRNQREVDVADAFKSAIDGVIAERPEAILVAGDLFHAVRPTNSAILHAVREFSRLQRALPGVPVIVIAGNHDTPRSSDTASIFGLLPELGIFVAADRAQRFLFPALDLSVLAVPHQALIETPRIAFEPAGTERYQVLLIHGETQGLFGDDTETREPGGAHLSDDDLRADWSYVALGHYHVQRQVAPRRWYAGSLDYVSTNPWGELREERNDHIPGKGWLMADLETGAVRRRAIDAPRRFLDLRWLDADDLAAPELDRLIADAVAAVPGGIAGAVVRQVVRGVSRAVGRELDHPRIRAWKNEALHFQLDLRPPESRQRIIGIGAPGHRQTLPDIVAGFLSERELPRDVDRSGFVAAGLGFLAAAESPPDES